jgi:hypothetical protein
MATKQDIIDLIDAHLKNNGKATGPEINKLLKEMLYYTENKEIDFFSFARQGVIDKKKAVSLTYSFRGIERETVNFTLILQGKKKNLAANLEVAEFTFLLDPTLFATLKRILNVDVPINFVVPLHLNSEDFIPTIMSLCLIDKEEKKLIIEIMDKRVLKLPFTIFTSIHFHCPNFKEIG